MNLSKPIQDQICGSIHEGLIAGGADLVEDVRVDRRRDSFYWVDRQDVGHERLCWFYLYDYYHRAPIWRFQADNYTMRLSRIYQKYRQNALHTAELGKWTMTQDEVLEGVIVHAIAKYSAERLRGILDHPPQAHFMDPIGPHEVYAWTPAANEIEPIIRRKREAERRRRIARGESRMLNGCEIAVPRAERGQRL